MDHNERRETARIRAKDHRTWTVVCERERPCLIRLAARLLGNDCEADIEDIVQEALLAAFKKADTFRGDNVVRKWLAGFVRIQCLRHRRKLKLLKRFDSYQPSDQVLDRLVSDDYERMLREELVAAVQARMLDIIASQLSFPAEAETLLYIFLRFRSGDDFPCAREMAEEKGCTESNASKRLYRARETLGYCFRSFDF